MMQTPGNSHDWAPSLWGLWNSAVTRVAMAMSLWWSLVPFPPLCTTLSGPCVFQLSCLSGSEF